MCCQAAAFTGQALPTLPEGLFHVQQERTLGPSEWYPSQQYHLHNSGHAALQVPDPALVTHNTQPQQSVAAEQAHAFVYSQPPQQQQPLPLPPPLQQQQQEAQSVLARRSLAAPQLLPPHNPHILLAPTMASHMASQPSATGQHWPASLPQHQAPAEWQQTALLPGQPAPVAWGDARPEAGLPQSLYGLRSGLHVCHAAEIAFVVHRNVVFGRTARGG